MAETEKIKKNRRTIGYALCGSFCTISHSLRILSILAGSGYDIIPIVSETLFSTDTRFGTAHDFITQLEQLCGKPVVNTICAAEPFGPRIVLDALIISPCTGNTLAKIVNSIADTSVTMTAKAFLRSDSSSPLVIALASNDAMCGSLKNIGHALERKRVYFVPMLQDDPNAKPHSLVADFERLPDTLSAAFYEKQVRPLFLT